MQYWYNVDTGRVEAHDDPGRARADQLMGPYPTQADAEAALAKAAARTDAWDEQERRDEEWASGDPRD